MKKKILNKKKKAFTLAETLITLTILGVVAAITIPALINRQQEAANRTKVKKAMTMYEKALNQMIIENDLKTNQSIIDFGAEGGACANTTEYFKKVEEKTPCRFKTADRIWWDITDIENPLIILNDKKKDETVANLQGLAKDTNDITTYAMIGRLDDTNSTIRINDNAFEQANGTADQKAYMSKLYGFVNSNSTTATNNEDKYCSCSGEGCCSSNCQGENVCVEKDVACRNNTTCVYDCFSISSEGNSCSAQRYIIDGEVYFVQKNGNITYWTMSSDGNGTTGYVYNMFLYENDDGTYDFVSNTGGTGDFINKITYDKDGNVIAFYNYDRGTCTRESCDWDMNPFLQLETTYYGGNYEWAHYYETGNQLFGSTDRASGGCGHETCSLLLTHKIIDEIVKKNK